jgi:hypothetical protein
MGLLKNLVVFLFWTLVFVGIVLATDQFFVRFDPKLPVLAEVRAFYVDFRARLLGLHPALPQVPGWARLPAGEEGAGRKEPPAAAAGRPAPAPAPAGASRPAAKPAAKPATPSAAAKPASRPAPPKAPASPPAAGPAAPAGAGYVYADARGELHFAASLEEIPAALRGSAQPLAR